MGVSWATTTNCGQLAVFSPTPVVRVLGAVGEDIGDASARREDDGRGVSCAAGVVVSEELVGVRGVVATA